MQPTGQAAYPVHFDVQYPDRELNRLTSAFRIIVAIPILVVLGSVDGGWAGWGWGHGREAAAGAGGLLFFAPLLMIVFRQKYPRWWFDWNRWLPLVKWLLAIPHYVVLFFLWIGAVVSIVVAWFAILFTGRYPRGLFDYLVGVGRWENRVVAYAFLMVTDQYPPFRLSP